MTNFQEQLFGPQSFLQFTLANDSWWENLVY